MLVLVLASYLMIVLDISIVITGLPKIRESLGFSPATLSWVHTAYTLAFGGLLMAGARAGDVFGRRRMLMLGLGLFVLASLAIGLATSPAMLVAARAVQGMGSALLAPATLALLYGAWRFVAPDRVQRGPLDVLGALLSTLGMVLLVFGLVEAAETGWHSRLSLALLVVVVDAASAEPSAGAVVDLAHRVAHCLGVSAGLLGVSLLVVLGCVLPGNGVTAKYGGTLPRP